MSSITLDIPSFRAQFVAFSDVTKFPDVMVQSWFDAATSYVSDVITPCIKIGTQTLMLNLMTAHLLAIVNGINNGSPLQAIVSAAEGTVNVGYVPPPVKNGWQWWLSSSPYGQQLWALLQAQSVGGFLVGSRRVRDGIRQTNGGFLGW